MTHFLFICLFVCFPFLIGYLPNSIYRQIRFGKSAIKKLAPIFQEDKRKHRHHTKYDWSFYKSRKTKRRLLHTQKQVKRFEIGTGADDTNKVKSAQLSLPRLSASTDNSDIRIATVSESSLYSIATSVRLLGLTEEEEQILKFMLQPEDLDVAGPPYKRTPQITPEPDNSERLSSRHQSSRLKDYQPMVDTGSSKTTSGQRVRFKPDHVLDSGENREKRTSIIPFQKEMTQSEKPEPEIHQLYDNLSM